MPTPTERATYVTAVCDQIGAAIDAGDMARVREGLDELTAMSRRSLRRSSSGWPSWA